jgi:prostaglandin-E synthase
MSSNLVHPSVIWAQRKNCILLTVCLDDCQSPEVKIEPTQFHFKGVGGTSKLEHEATLELYGEVVPETSSYVVRARNIEVILKKKEEAFWPRLTKGTAKLPWLKVDFDKWKDEDDSADEGIGGFGGGDSMMDYEQMLKNMAGAGMGDSNDFGGKAGFDDFDAKTDSDDDDEEATLPDLE